MTDIRQELLEKAKAMGIKLTAQQADQFQTYMELLLEWNEKINLTAITQPEIYHRLDLAMAEARQAGEKLFFVDGAVIVGTPFQKRCSHLVLVAAPYETSVQRICARDGIAPEMARRRLDAQLPENVLRAAADFVIENDGTLQQMQQRCNALLTALRKEAYGETSDEK
mgnify:CR=1 FL=1